MTDQSAPATPPQSLPRLGEIGLSNYVPYLMNRIMGRYNASLREEMAALGLTTPKMRTLAVLSVIEGPPDPRAGGLFCRGGSRRCPAPSISLPQRGLIRREADASDSRATRIFITAAGRAAFEMLWPKMAEAHARMFRGISTEERRFVGTLQKMLSNIRKHEI